MSSYSHSTGGAHLKDSIIFKRCNLFHFFFKDLVGNYKLNFERENLDRIYKNFSRKVVEGGWNCSEISSCPAGLLSGCLGPTGGAA